MLVSQTNPNGIDACFLLLISIPLKKEWLLVTCVTTKNVMIIIHFIFLGTFEENKIEGKYVFCSLVFMTSLSYV